MVSMRTKKPLSMDDLKMAPGKVKRQVIDEVISGTARGTRRAVKVDVIKGNKAIVGWASRHWFKYISIYQAKNQKREKKNDLHKQK